MKKLHYPCLIIGAGIAGLVAAKQLRENGLDAPILEARERAGGRIAVHREWGMPLAYGAHWIHGGKDNPMLTLAQQFSAPLAPFTRNYQYFFTQTGKHISQKIVETFQDQFREILSEAKTRASQLETDTALENVLNPFISQYLTNAAGRALVTSQFKFFENYMGAGAEQLSAKYWDLADPGPEENFRVLDAFDSIVEGLSNPCDIRFNCVVEEINYDVHPIEIITRSQTFYADKIILTVPLGVLKNQSIQFYPLLPEKKQKAITRLNMGIFDITALQFEYPFLPEDASIIYVENQDSIACSTFLNMHPVIQQPIVYGYTGGKTASVLENLSDTDIIDRMLVSLKRAFGKKVPDVKRYYVTRWLQDPFSFGSYSYTPVGATIEDYLALSEPVGDCVFFAGEATKAHQYDSTTQAAYFSGLHTADAVLKRKFRTTPRSAW